MRKVLLFLMAVTLVLTSCDDYGKKININDKNEVYYKGDGVTEADAKKLGEYLKTMGYFNGTKELTVQLTKENEAYNVRFVSDKEAFEKSKDQLSTIFWFWQDLISENVFGGKKTTITLADEKLKDFQKIEEINKVKLGDNQVYYKGEIKKDEAENLTTWLKDAEFFKYAGQDIIVDKKNNAYSIRFMPNQQAMDAQGDEQYLAVLKNYQYLIGKYGLNGNDVKLYVINSDFNDIHKFEESTTEEKAAMDQLMQASQTTTDTQE